MGELVYVLAVNLQLLSAYCISWLAVCTAGFRGFCATGTEGVEELILSFQIVPLKSSVHVAPLFLQHSYLYARILGSEVDSAMVGRVRDAEDVSYVVGRPESVEMLEGRCAPDLRARLTHVFIYILRYAYIDYGVCGTRKQQLLVLRQTQTEYAAFVRIDDSPALIGIEAVDLLAVSLADATCLHTHIPVSPLPVYQRVCIWRTRQV
jgi:hypothetical protein